MAAANAPITMKEALTLTSLGINPQFITFTNVTMESDKYICVRETAPQNSVVIIDMSMPNQPLRRPITADSALMNPNSRILALKAQLPGTTQDHLQIFNIEAKAKIKSYQMPEQVVFWKWITPKMLGLVTQTAVYHWPIEGDSEPVKMFDRTANLANNQIINYKCDPSEKWLVLIGIAPGSPERPQLVKGNMQLFSVDQQRSQALEAHAASFASFRVPGNDKDSILIAFATKGSNAGQVTSKLHVIELGAQPGKPSFTKKQADLFFPPDFADDFPVAMQISHKYSLIYVITKLGLLFVYDLDTATAVYRNRISPDPIFLTSEASSIGGFYAINRRGQVLLATVNEATIVPFVSGQLNNLELAVNLAKRGNLPGAENLNFRCTLRRSPSSSLTNDCIAAMAEGLSPSLYNHFLGLLWGDDDSNYVSKANSSADSEWESFCNVITKLCQRPNTISQLSDSVSSSSWEFLTKSKYNQQYLRNNYVAGAFSGLSSNVKESDSSDATAIHTQNTDETFCHKLLTEIVDSLHAVYETLKLDNLRKRDLGLLVVLLYDIADFLHEPGYLDHYKRDFPGLLKDFVMSQFLCTSRTPPNLFRWLENCLQHGCDSASVCDLPFLVCRNGTSVVDWARKIISFYSLLCGAEQSGKRLSTSVTCDIVPGLFRTREELTVLGMVGERFGLHHLDLLPAGVSLPLRHAIDKCRESPPTNWPAAAYVLLGREDLALLQLRDPTKYPDLDCTRSNLILVSTPYMLPLHPVTIPSSVSDTLEMDDTELGDIDNFEGPVADGMDHIFNSSTQLRYGRDLRLNEVRRLLCSARPVAIQTPVNPTASDQDFQQTQLLHLAQRTTALPFGRGAFTLGTICTLLTEALVVPKLVLAGRLPAQQNATVNLDSNVGNIQELKSWPEFHNAVAAGLRLSPLQGKMSRTWILYNKPDEPNVTHAGLLLALGLHGHLRVLTITDIFQYYSQEHESTTVGLMIGLAASYRGTMQPSISKSLYVHLPARHPSSFPELELPTLIQSAALISVGLLYEGSAHPQTMQILLSEIGRRSGGDNVREREGYAVSAGFALGLVALGRGQDAIGSVDTLADRLFHYIGGKELHNDRPFSSSADENNRSVGQVIDGNVVNIDVTAPGAIIALALMYLKTESELIVSRLSIPQTKFELQYIRPDFILLRVIARNLILWTRIQPSENWIQSQIPEVVKNGVSGLENKMDDVYEMDAEAFVQAYVNIVVGACISLGLRFAGTRDGNAQELLYKYAVYFLNEIKPVCASNANGLPKGLSHYVDRGTLEAYLHLIVLSLCVVMAGSGHLQTFKFLKFLLCRNSADGHAGFGTQMAVSLAIGFLFIGGGMWTFSTSNSSIAALLITLYPRLPTVPNDNRCHLQAFRHLYVLATEARWIQTVDVDTGLPVYAPLEITNKETELYSETSFCEITPCSLPERAILKSVRVCGPRYWPQLVELCPKEKPWWDSGENHHPFNSGVLYVKRKVGACSYVDDPIGSQSLLSRAMHKMSALTQPKSCLSPTECTDAIPVDQLVSTFSSDPSLIAFAQLFCDSSWSNRFELDFQEFCQQVLFECVSKDRPALLQVYLSLYATIGYIMDSVVGDTSILADSLSLSSLKIALAYNEALSNGRLTNSRGEIMQSSFLGSLRKRVEDVLNCSTDLNASISNYTLSWKWPTDDSHMMKASITLSWYLQWYSVPSPLDIKRAAEKIKSAKTSSSVPLLRLVFPTTHVAAIDIINTFLSSSLVEG